MNSTQVPHIIRLGLAEVLGIEERVIRVVAPDVGGGFGSKARLLPEEVIVAALGRAARSPGALDRGSRRALSPSTHARDHDYKITAYADARGVILAVDAELIVDAGAYALWPNGPFLETGMAARNIPGPYNIRNWRVKSFTVATNKAPIGPYRGVGRPGACFAIERTIDEIARQVGRDPLDVRFDNLVQPSQMPYMTIANLLFDNGDYPALLRLCAETIDVAAVRARQKKGEPDGRLIGLGFACYSEQTGHGCGEWVTRGSPFIPGFRKLPGPTHAGRHACALCRDPIPRPGTGNDACAGRIRGARYPSRKDFRSPRRHRLVAVRKRNDCLPQHRHGGWRRREDQPPAARKGSSRSAPISCSAVRRKRAARAARYTVRAGP